MPIPPLNPSVPIVDKDGKPTPEFIQWWQRQRVAGNQVTPLGTGAEVSAVLDKIGAVRGDILYRGPSNWNVLAPGIAGRVLQTGGAGADPSWAVAGGSFITLSDAPSSYVGQAGKVATVNPGETGLIFSAPAGVGGGNTPPLFIGGLNTFSRNAAARGNPITPQTTFTLKSLWAIWDTAAGITYQAGVAPFNTATRKFTAAPTLSAAFTEGAAAVTGRYIGFGFATPPTLTAGTTYILYYFRTDSATGVMNCYYNTSPAWYFPTVGRQSGTPSYWLASALPGTSDVWTSETGYYMIAPMP